MKELAPQKKNIEKQITELVLKNLETDEIRCFLWRSTCSGAGFLDDNRLWYTWADSTYIMEL